MTRARIGTMLLVVACAVILIIALTACDGPALNCAAQPGGEIRCTPNSDVGGGGGTGGGW